MSGLDDDGRVVRQADGYGNREQRGVCRLLSRLKLTLLSIIAVSLWGCSQAEFYQQKVDTARRHLQLSEDQAALDVLSVTNDSKATPEYHYLKAVTLERLGRNEAATAEIARAIKTEPDNPKYKGFELKLKMFARDRASVDQLLQLNDQFASVGPVALYATFAFQAKAILLEGENKPKAADFHTQRKRQTLETALTLAKDMPEYHRDLIVFALQNQKLDEALKLINGILELDPKSITGRNQKIQTLMLLKQPDKAVSIAKQLYEEGGKRVAGAEAYATILSATSQTAEHDAAFSDLRQELPFNPTIITKYAGYLTRAGHLLKAFELLDKAVKEQPDKAVRQHLAFVSISLPLEIESAEFAEDRLRIYRSEINDPLLLDYFEARLMYLKKQHHEAVQKMLNIIAAERKSPGRSTVLASEALNWVRRILADRLVGDQIKNAIDQTQQTPLVRKATEEEAKEEK